MLRYKIFTNQMLIINYSLKTVSILTGRWLFNKTVEIMIAS